MAEYNFNKMFQGDYSGLLNNNKYAQNIKNANALDLPIPKNTGLISNQPTANQNNNQSFAQPQYKDRTFIDKYLRRENPDNVKIRNDRNRAMIQDYMYNQIDNDEDRLLFSLDPKNWIAKHTDSKFKDENRSGHHKGRPYTTRKDTGLLHYLDGAQEQVFIDADSSNVGNQHSTIELYNAWKNAEDPALKNYLFKQLEAIGDNKNSIITVSTAPDGTQSVTIGGENTSGSTTDGVGVSGIAKSGVSADGSVHIQPSDITSYLKDGKYNREFEAAYQSDQQKALKFNGIMNEIDDIGIDYLLTQRGAIERYGIEKLVKMGGEEFASSIVSSESLEKYGKATQIIAEQTGMLNAYIKEITGAQMSETEVKRLVQALANMGVTGSLGQVFGAGDNPIAFRMKFDIVMKHVQEARARRYFYIKNEEVTDILKTDYPALMGIDYELNTRNIENDVYTMTKSQDGNDNTGTILDTSYSYQTNDNYWMDDFRIRDLMNQVQDYDLRRNRTNYATSLGITYEEYLSALTDPDHPDQEKIQELDMRADLQAIQSRNELFGLGANELTMNQRKKFKDFDDWKNRDRTGGNFYSINDDIFKQSMGVQ